MRNNTPNYSFFQAVTQYLIVILVCSLLVATPIALAASLENRIAQFPQWTSKPSVKSATGDLEYPEWMAGTWNVTSTLVEQFAPLAPDIVTPGFEDNQKYLDRPVAFQVRFGNEYATPHSGLFSVLKSTRPMVVADRAFNGKKIAEAYLGEDNVYRVKVDPEHPDRQITLLKGDRKLISRITGRGRELPTGDRFIATEVTQQLFRSPERLYLNEVETTSSYELLDSEHIGAEQITAIYLSPQDPDYFTAGDRPVALYHYHLVLTKQK